MHCMACGAEMILVKTIEDVSMPIAGFERRAYMCSLCHETEQRLVFNKRPEEREPDPPPRQHPLCQPPWLGISCKQQSLL